MTDYKKLCAELLDRLKGLYDELVDSEMGWVPPEAQELMTRTHAALAEGDGPAVPDGREPASVTGEPSDEELLELMPQQMRDDLAAAARAMSGFDPDNIKAASVFRIILNRHVADHARAVLARWGRQAAPVPVAVCERLPEPGVKVLAHYFNDLGKGRTICAIWVPAKTRSDSYGDDDFTEYDEVSDTFYWPEGWYEAIENWDDLGYVRVDEGEVIYWQSLPKWPAHALPLPITELQP